MQHPENFVGIHFFSPVEKMDPVEIVRGEQTSDEALAKAIDFVLAIGKYPIVVNDGRGFFTTRVFATFPTEARPRRRRSRPALAWPGLRDGYTTDEASDVALKDLADRFLFIQALETQRCFDEGVINSDPAANIGSIFGIGFPAWTGGVRQYVSGYPGGPTAFEARAQTLAATHGPQADQGLSRQSTRVKIRASVLKRGRCQPCCPCGPRSRHRATSPGHPLTIR